MNESSLKRNNFEKEGSLPGTILRWQDMYCSIFLSLWGVCKTTRPTDSSRTTRAAMVAMVRPSGRSRLLVLFLGLRDMENFVGICVGEKWTLQQPGIYLDVPGS